MCSHYDTTAMPSRVPCSGDHILLHDRTVDDTTAIIDAGIDVADEYYEEIRVTETQTTEDKTRREYRNRLKHIYRWWMETYPAYV